MFGHGMETGVLRETFFANQVGFGHSLHFPEKGDFLVDEKYTFKTGRKNKDRSQLPQSTQSFLALNDVEYGAKGTIPLWMFGFLY